VDAEAGVGAFNEGMAVFRQGGSARASLLRGGLFRSGASRQAGVVVAEWAGGLRDV